MLARRGGGLGGCTGFIGRSGCRLVLLGATVEGMGAAIIAAFHLINHGPFPNCHPPRIGSPPNHMRSNRGSRKDKEDACKDTQGNAQIVVEVQGSGQKRTRRAERGSFAGSRHTHVEIRHANETNARYNKKNVLINISRADSPKRRSSMLHPSLDIVAEANGCQKREHRHNQGNIHIHWAI